VKTTNLTPWCNLFSIESKYSICIQKSRYKTLVFAGSLAALVILPLLFFTYAYFLALTLVVIAAVLFSVYVSNSGTPLDFVNTFELSEQGICSFAESDEHYQLQESSRFSFLGCWLIFQPISLSHLQYNMNTNLDKKQITLFIYRDSLSAQDFSRLAKVISQLNPVY